MTPGSRYPNLDKSFKNSDTEVPRYMNRGGGLGIWTSSDIISSDSESLKGVEFVQNLWNAL